VKYATVMSLLLDVYYDKFKYKNYIFYIENKSILKINGLLKIMDNFFF